MKLLSVLLLLAGSTFADEIIKKTEVTVNEPIIVAGVPQLTLQPGKYILRLLNHDHTRNIVQIFDRDDRLITTILAINNYRLMPTDKTVLQFWETPSGNPPALRAWFAPGDQWGQEFVYPKGLATRIARESGGPVLTARATTEAELRTAPVTEIIKSGEEKPLEEQYTPPSETLVAQAQPPAQPVPVPAPSPRQPAREVTANPAQEPVPSESVASQPLPETGSPVFEIGLLGLLMAVGGFALRRVALNRS